MELVKLAPNLIAIFIFVLIISGNYLGELFPCKVQQIFKNNMYVKHTLGFLTLLFFVTLTIPEVKQQDNFISFTILIYIWFILMTKCYYTIWFLVFGMIGILYLLQIYKNEKNEKVEIVNNIEKTLIISSFIMTIIGFFIYMGIKKREYKDKFRYLNFIFGPPDCKDGYSKFPGYLILLKNAFN